MLRPEIIVKITVIISIMFLYVWLFGTVRYAGSETEYYADELLQSRNPVIDDATAQSSFDLNGGEFDFFQTQSPLWRGSSIMLRDVIFPKPEDYPLQSEAGAAANFEAYEENLAVSESIAREQEKFASTTAPQTTAATTTTTKAVQTDDDGVPIATLEPEKETTTEVTTTRTTPTTETLTTAEPITPPEKPSEYPSAHTDVPDITVKDLNGNIYTDSAFTIICLAVQVEIGGSFPEEAIKAQAVSAYSYFQNRSVAGQYATLYNTNFSKVHDRVKVCVAEVLGQAVYYNGEMIQGVYSASSAGYTASAVNVWGVNLPYLVSTPTPFDVGYDPNYGLTKTFTSTEMKNYVYDETKINLTGNPAEWFKIISYSDGVYVEDMLVGGNTTYVKNGSPKKISGRVFRELIMDFDIKSACFKIEYNGDSDKFTITTYGYGHGVGFSQNGAKYLAKYGADGSGGWDYIQILNFYYPGTEIR